MVTNSVQLPRQPNICRPLLDGFGLVTVGYFLDYQKEITISMCATLGSLREEGQMRECNFKNEGTCIAKQDTFITQLFEA